MKFTRDTIVISTIFFITVLLWIIFVVGTGHTATYEGPLYEFVLKPFLVGMTLLPLVGGIFGLKKAQKWGGLQSKLGRALTGLSAGLITWAGGMVIWNYYLFFTTVEVPYPSLADASFILSWPLWSYGVFELSHATGAKFGLRKKYGLLTLFSIPVIVALISYYLLFHVARQGVMDFSVGALKLFFDLFYPIGDILILTTIVVVYSLSRNFLGGRYKKPILFLFFGFLLNYITDFIFSYTTTVETYFNGHYVDLFFTITMFVLSLAINHLDPSKET